MSEQELWNELGNLYFLSGSYGQAANAYERSIRLDTGFGRPYSNLALTYVQQGKFEEAIELYRRSIELLTDDKEKAVSWNRLGTVYRHLKDYSKAVIAFQEADELDPESASDFPATARGPQEAAAGPSSVLDEPTPVPAKVDEIADAEPEWWDVDERRVDAATQAVAPATVTDDPRQSWTPADPTEFQQDVSQMPQAGSQTTWGDAELEDTFEVFSPSGLEPEVDLPEVDEDLSTWLPIPEEEPWSADQLEIPPFLEELAPEPAEPAFDWNRVSTFHVVETVDFGPVLSPAESAPVAMDYANDRTESSFPRASLASQQTWEPQEVDVVVEERPASELPLPVERSPEPAIVAQAISRDLQAEPAINIQAIREELQPESEPEPVAISPTPEMERDAEEMREIEIGIEKFKRVVQLNPRNAHAWDALGTLYKSAGQYKDAILAYQQAISNDGSRSLYYHHLGLVYACEGRDEDAIGAFQRVIEIDPDYSLAHATLGGYYRKMGLEELAQKHIGKAMKNIFDSENEYNRACLEAICGNADQAIELLGVALKNKQTYVDWILRDPDLDFIRQDPRFKQLISQYTR